MKTTIQTSNPKQKFMISYIWIVIKKYVGGKLLVILKNDFMNTTDLKNGNRNNGLIAHNLETNQNFNSKNSNMLVYIYVYIE